MTSLVQAEIILAARRELPLRFPGWANTKQMADFEKEYGKYLVVPLDVEPIVPDNVARFKEWYFEVAAPTRRVRADIAGSSGANLNVFQTIDSQPSENPIWKENIHDVLAEFPELGEKIKQLPFVNPPMYRVWSSNMRVNPHRDSGPWIDAPVGFRAVMFDENPTQTLFLCEDPLNAEKTYRTFPVPRVSPVFGWSNIRATHYSMFNPKFRKAIMIFHNELFDIDRCANLLERSIAKFGAKCSVSKFPASAFY